MEKLIIALTELEKLKYVERGTNVKGRKESTAEHSWSCLLIADILIDYVEEPLNS
jgi:putative hydrolase of HD superfamily